MLRLPTQLCIQEWHEAAQWQEPGCAASKSILGEVWNKDAAYPSGVASSGRAVS